MSHSVSVVVLPQVHLIPAGMSFGTAAAAGGLVALAGYGSYVAIRKLHKDYQEAYAEFQDRSQAELQRRLDFSNREHAALAASVGLAEGTKALAVEDATIRFVHARVALLVQRLPQPEGPDSDIRLQCLTLLKEIEDHPLEVAAAFEKYRALAARAAALLAASSEGSTLKAALSDDLAALREEINSPLLDEERHADLRAQLLAQCTSLEAMIAKQPVVAKQGLVLLRERLHRELQQQAIEQQRRIGNAEEVRTLVGEALAKLRAVSQQELAPELGQQSTALLEQLSVVLGRQQTDELTALRQLAQEADTLFTTCLQLFEEQTIADYLGDQISDVLLTMGYQVAQVPPESPSEHRAYRADVGDGLGLEFHLDGRGHIGTETVALSPQAVDIDHAAQERVCSLEDKVFAALKARECVVRERFRSSLSPGEQLRVVEVSNEEPVVVVAEELKQMRVE